MPFTNRTLRYDDYIITPQANIVASDLWTTNTDRFITSKDLEHFSQKIYKIIEEHTPLDITEEEFMKLIKDDS